MDMKEKVQELVDAPTVCPEAKAAGEAYLKAYGTSDQKKAADRLLAELREDVNNVDSAISFGSSEKGKQILGSGAADFLAAAKKAKEAGEKYCICPACQAGGFLLDHADEL